MHTTTTTGNLWTARPRGVDTYGQHLDTSGHQPFAPVCAAQPQAGNAAGGFQSTSQHRWPEAVKRSWTTKSGSLD